MKKIIALSLVAGGLAFAQSGLQGGTSGIHQHNAYTLGQWGFEIGVGGEASYDSWSHSRNGEITKDGKASSFHRHAGELSGNVHAAIGLKDFVDLGVSLPLYYDHANTKTLGEGDMWKASRGDLDVWMKVGAIGDAKSFFALAALIDVYIPTGETGAGVRPRHAWYLNDEGGATNPYTSDEVNFSGTLILSLNFGALGLPVVWNSHAGYVFAEQGTNTLVYGTGLNILPSDWLDIFVEYTGEMRVEKGAYRRDPKDDPMLLTPGLRFHLPGNVDLAMGVDIAFRTLTNFGYDADEELKNVQSHIVHYYDEDGSKVVYGYAPTPTIAATASLTWRFGGYTKTDSDEDGVWDSDDQCANTPKVATVDSVGCPIDSDQDGLIDGIDQCPDTPMGAEIDTTGCTIITGNGDGDKDGIVDSLDKCPNSREGASVDSLGCEPDFDKDGVPDLLDKCPNTPAGVKVDTVGCSMDSDKDGVYDGLDKCENTPAGLPVDATGCPADADKDGIADAFDQCPNTPAGLPVDTLGCPADADKDGVPDAMDKCPNTQEGAQVNAEGCEGDFDGDGIPDAKDQCPNTKQGVAVDSTGCPADADKDGVPDALDKCPDTKIGLNVDNTGCPLDFDKDGIPDGLDQCPNTMQGVPVDSLGCAADADKDGVYDGLDKCPDTPAGASVDTVGCPVDTDKDGVPDFIDKCPNTLEGVRIDKKGCPLNKKEDLEQLKKGINFQTGSTKLTKASYKTLNDIVKLMKKFSTANIEVQGHTDNTGSEDKNKQISQDRAQVVVDYFIQNGISSDRLRAVGFGSDKPIADNKTKKGRSKNRRVELVAF